MDSYCAAPFRHIVYRSDGRTKPCCMWDDSAWDAKRDQTWGIRAPMANNDPFNHKWMQSLRTAMLSNEKVSGCNECYLRESAGYSSLRHSFNQIYGRPADANLRYVEFNLGNLCNLKCRMCDSWSSSKWIADEIALGIEPVPLTRPNIKMVRADLSTIDKLRFVGGEPTLEQSVMVAVLERILELCGSLSHLEVSITTNCVILLDDKLIKLLSACKQVDLQCSIDGVGKINDYQRTGSDWATLLDNLVWYQRNLSDNFKLVILTSWSIINANDAVGFLGFVIDKLPRYYVWGHLVRDPAYLQINNIPRSAKLNIAARLNSWVVHDNLHWVRHNKQVIQSQFREIPAVPADEVLHFIARLDQLRNESFADINPEMHAALVAACENTNQA